jgi:hypothetical protein
VLNAKSPAGYNDSKALYDWGFLNFDALEAKATDVIVPLTPPSAVSAAARKAAVPITEAAAGAVPGSRPVRDAIPMDDVLLGVLVASVLGAWFLSARRGTNAAYREEPAGAASPSPGRPGRVEFSSSFVENSTHPGCFVEAVRARRA